MNAESPVGEGRTEQDDATGIREGTASSNDLE
jgi:hypothetical protein